MDKFIVTKRFNKRIKTNLSFLLIFIWMLTTSQECNNTISDACGSYEVKVAEDKIRLILSTREIPPGAAYPVIETYNGVPNTINIGNSLSSNIESTIFQIKTESYVQCNGIPRSTITCCRTYNQACNISSVLNNYELPLVWNPVFKYKVTITAITRVLFPSGVTPIPTLRWFYYIGTFDINQSQTSLALGSTVTLKYKSAGQSTNLDLPLTDCNSN